MKYYHTYNGTLLAVGDIVNVTGVGDVRILSLTRTKIAGTCVVYGDERRLDVACGFEIHECPPLAVYDRITGKRLMAGDTTSSGAKIEEHYESCVGMKDVCGVFRWIELAANKLHVDSGIEVRAYPTFEELYQLKRELNSAGEWCVRGLRNRLLPAANAIMMDRYRDISGFLPLAVSGVYVKADIAGHVLVVGNKLAPENRVKMVTVGPHAGQMAWIYDIHILPDESVALEKELVRVRFQDGVRLMMEAPAEAGVFNNELVMRDALTNCAGTGELMLRCDALRVDGRLYSRGYVEENARLCNVCDGRFFGDSLRCEACSAENKYRIRGYCNRDANYFKPTSNTKLKFGIELEVGCDKDFGRSECAKTFIDAVAKHTDPEEYVVLKEDGSLSECNGFEIVTRPDGPDVHKRIFERVLAVPEIQEQMSSWDNGLCGIHIHVSREPLSQLWVGRMLVLINAEPMRKLVHKVAGRGSNTYTQYFEKKLSDGSFANVSEDRYEALNVSGDKTIEFRIFRGTLKPEGFIKNIEFVEAVLEYCRPAARSLRTLDQPEEFIRFVNKNRKAYPLLNAFLQAKCIH